jgi:hypothetical protein
VPDYDLTAIFWHRFSVKTCAVPERTCADTGFDEKKLCSVPISTNPNDWRRLAGDQGEAAEVRICLFYGIKPSRRLSAGPMRNDQSSGSKAGRCEPKNDFKAICGGCSANLPAPSPFRAA